MGPLANLFSTIDSAKRKFGGLLENPMGTFEQLMGQMQDYRRQDQQLGDQAFGDPKKGEPLVKDRQAFAQLGQRTFDNLMSFAPAGMTVKTKARTQAPAGGTSETTNGFFYKGGQFLPTTEAEPGKWKIGKKWVTSGKELVAPGVLEQQPTPFSRGIFGMMHSYLEPNGQGGFKFREGVGAPDGGSLDINAKFRPGVKGLLGTEEYTLAQLLDEYNKGNRWVNLNFDEPTLTSIKFQPD